MAKPKPVIALRKPPELSERQVLDAFVRGDAQDSKGPSAQTSKRSKPEVVSSPTTQTSRSVVHRVDGRELRRMTIYLPTELAKKLRMQCAAADIDVSSFVTDALAARLDS